MKPVLVVLAAGIGSRFGGLKQLAAVGPHDAKIIDYSVFDAQRAGFARVVFIIRPDMRDEFHACVAERFASRIDVAYAEQRLDDLPDGRTPPAERTKPWGTGHALLAAREQVEGPFAVINADDFYGRRSFEVLAEHLRAAKPGDWAAVGFRLRDTLSDHGAVSRGVCEADASGHLVRITETIGIERRGDGGVWRDERGDEHDLPGDTPVSMNLWGFTRDVFEHVRRGFDAFLEKHGDELKAEYYLPTPVQAAIRAGEARVRVLPTDEKWIGLTHPQDLEVVRAAIAEKIAAGDYRENLWA
ncbi:MAG: nucleotidyltransferase [Planctomycetota bacterium]|nr:MAG: nucleotidyltransferase [Planctomycetota bacterium]